jgi:PKD repeat protein
VHGQGRSGLVNNMHPHNTRFAVLGVSVLSLALLAGCAGLDDSDTQTTGKNRNPEAVINIVDGEDVINSGEPISFDAKGSEDEDGEIVSYRYSFGDGSSAEATDEDDPVQHVYLKGGEYIVTLTVTDNGNDRAGELTDTATVEVTVNEEIPIAEGVVAADPAGVDAAEQMNQTFEVHESADRFELDLEATGSLVTGSSELEVTVTDAEGDVLQQKTVTVQGTDTETIELNGILLDTGLHKVEVTAKSGGGTVSGTMKVFYGAEDA